jgi:hypothetical protein
MTGGFRIEKLRRDHPIDGFTCGREELDRYLKRYALGNQQANAAQTYLALHEAEVIAFYSLVVGEIAFVDAPGRSSLQGLIEQSWPNMIDCNNDKK